MRIKRETLNSITIAAGYFLWFGVFYFSIYGFMGTLFPEAVEGLKVLAGFAGSIVIVVSIIDVKPYQKKQPKLPGAKEKVHHVKTHPREFESIRIGKRPLTVQKADTYEKDYCQGDWISFEEYDLTCGRYTGRLIYRKITMVLDGAHFGVEPGYIILSFEEP